ncbi:hypothetical protein [Riemerella anatipestifer]|uniref:hypothetical protein n=1 Tax=Riemerella anatipestifer TaxID=34085 RepID=UPI001BDA44B2|nr:hypothetical protein [Riemerella anatipestifer]MBT0553495.1 hypothetical protein [Riemerella anatipestifer]MCE3024302.1 hypothetical protein [Riemerella anatipestifer]MCU7559033.1 hypothetical protein [Riemerella anatipestifer]MDY3448882.1 hypothetical protein [Riemerella anatipestifer]QYR02935.1 hypothetical protein J6M00_00520 [Riemerella anatipestifer]
MEIPFYTSFKEFKDNYETDLEKWLSIYPDGDEMDYLGYVYERYSDYAVTDISGITIDERCYKDKEVLALVNFVEVEGLPEKYEYKAEGFQVKYKYYDEGNGKYYRVFTIKELVNKIILMINKVKIYYTYIENKDYKKIKELLEFSSSYTPYKESSEVFAVYTYKLEDIVEAVSFIRFNQYDNEILFDNTKYNNFKLSIPKIYKFISDRKKEINGVQTTDEVTPTAEEQHTTTEEHEKITINGSIQLIGYIFTELIEKGYIEPKRKSGKTNASATAEMLLNHFNFTYNANGEQPSKEYLKKALSEQNQLSPDKATLIKIPHLKKLID